MNSYNYLQSRLHAFKEQKRFVVVAAELFKISIADALQPPVETTKLESIHNLITSAKF